MNNFLKVVAKGIGGQVGDVSDGRSLEDSIGVILNAVFGIIGVVIGLIVTLLAFAIVNFVLGSIK